ncbi:MAG TPA: response regulator transcription factor [Elusimicrobiota bacterium]|jgi:DNA-binding NarL/FixJ family response regulator|nr:response regulator transcription factor [Elusimicrobiota bacterium]
MKKNAKSPARKPLKVMLADDETLFRDVIRDLLAAEKNVSVVGEASDGHEAVRMAKALKPDVVLMDINLPLLSGINATMAIRKDSPKTKVLMLSAYTDEVHVMESVQAGAYGYLSKKLPGTELVRALKAFAEQGTLIPPPVMQSVLNRLHGTGPDTGVGSLTSTQMRVLALLGEGKSNKEIAAELDCNVKTVKNHLNILFQKFDVKNRTEAVVKGIKAGLITGRDPHQYPH